MKKIMVLSAALFLVLSAFSQTGSITNVQAEQRDDGSGLVDINYDLAGPEDSYFINIRVSFDAGDTYWPVSFGSLEGDVAEVSPGSRHMIWNPAVDHPNRYSPATKIKLIAYFEDSFNPCPGSTVVMDYDGNVYNTILIGDQCWMASNLNTTRDANGNLISRYCYDDDLEYCELYGGLYNWSTVMNGASSSSGNPSGVQGICPDGWHVPSDSEWTELTNYLINNYIDITADNVGNKLKSCRQVSSPLGGDCSTSTHPRWDQHGTYYGTNDFGFASLPGGIKLGGSYGSLGSNGLWWSCTQYSSTIAWYRQMSFNYGNVGRNYGSKDFGSSVRCLRD